MKTQWIVSADASGARVPEQRPGNTAGHAHVDALVHAQRRQKGEQLASDRPASAIPGFVRSHLGVQAKELLLPTVAHGCTALRDDALARRLGMHARPPCPPGPGAPA